MSKLIITDVENGEITYIVGEEVKTTVPEIEKRIEEIDNILKNQPTHSSKKEEIAIRASDAINTKKIEIIDKKASLDLEFDNYVKDVEEEKAILFKEIEEEERKDNSYFEDLSREKAKLMAILSNIPKEDEGVEEVIENEKVDESPVPEEEELEIKAEDIKDIEMVDEVPEGVKIEGGVKIVGESKAVDGALEKITDTAKEEVKVEEAVKDEQPVIQKPRKRIIF